MTKARSNSQLVTPSVGARAPEPYGIYRPMEGSFGVARGMKGGKLYNGSKTATSSAKSFKVTRETRSSDRNIRAMLETQKLKEVSQSKVDLATIQDVELDHLQIAGKSVDELPSVKKPVRSEAHDSRYKVTLDEMVEYYGKTPAYEGIPEMAYKPDRGNGEKKICKWTNEKGGKNTYIE